MTTTPKPTTAHRLPASSAASSSASERSDRASSPPRRNRASSGADVLRASGLPGLLLLVLAILLIFVLGLLLTSGSAQWSRMAPVLVPMLLLVEVDAVETQAAFRIGDSIATL